MQKNAKSRLPGLKTRPERAGALMWLGRSLLVLSAISLLTAPVTQHIWTWDHFLRGGQDFELTALMLFIAFALVLVLRRQCRQYVDLLLARCCLLARKFTRHKVAGVARHWTFSIVRTGQVTCPGSTFCNIPLRI